jgi:hypothetical protein
MPTKYMQTQNQTPLTMTVTRSQGHKATRSKKAKAKMKKTATHAFRKEKYSLQGMKLYKSLQPVLFKTTIERVKRGQIPNKNPIDVVDAPPWENADKRMEDLPINPSIAQMWRCLFNNDEKTPLQKSMVTVNTGNPVSRGGMSK